MSFVLGGAEKGGKQPKQHEKRAIEDHHKQPDHFFALLSAPSLPARDARRGSMLNDLLDGRIILPPLRPASAASSRLTEKARFSGLPALPPLEDISLRFSGVMEAKPRLPDGTTAQFDSSATISTPSLYREHR
jgi:hypothetical protein